MAHDPKCPAATRCGCKRCECALIKDVRADQATKSYREGYNDCARAQQRALIEYGGRPTIPAYERGRADERHDLWHLLEPVVTEIAMRNGADGG